MAQGVRYLRRNSGKFGQALVMFFITSIMCLGLLSMLRNDSQRMDEAISAVQGQLEMCEKECRDLEREAAAMMSPRAIHAYAAHQLGMTQVHLAGAVRLDVAGRSGGTRAASLIGSGVALSR